jgi:hypothetical protein
MGEFSRIVGVFFEPAKTFADIAQRPTWLVPVILAILAGLAFTVALSQRVGWDRVVRQQLEASSRVQQMSQDQREQATAMQIKIMPPMFYGGVVVGTPIYCIVVAAILLGITAIMSAGLRFKQVFAAVAWGGMPRLISAILTIVVIFLKNPDDFNLKNPLAFNVGAFMDPNGPNKFLYALASSLDLFTIWTIFLMATGLKAAAGKKLSFTGAVVAVAAPWALFVLGSSAVAGAFS